MSRDDGLDSIKGSRGMVVVVGAAEWGTLVTIMITTTTTIKDLL